MADRYWVGGTGSWSSANTANWAASSGGASGVSVPTAADNVFFDVNSNVGTTAFTVTMANSPRVCNDFTASGLDGTMTLAGASNLTVSGSLTFQATNFSRTYTGTTTFNATTTGKTITTNGVTLGGSVTFDGVGGGWTLGSALTLPAGTSAVSLVNGSLFDTANYNVSGWRQFATNTFSGTISFGSSTLTSSLNLQSAPLTINNTATYTANTCTFDIQFGFGQIALNSSNAIYNLIIRSVSTQSAQNYRSTVGNALNLNNLTVHASPLGATNGGGIQVQFFGFSSVTIAGTFSTSGTTYNNRVSFNGAQAVVPISVATASLADIDFAFISFTGAATPLTGTRLGNIGNVSGVTFNAARTVYWSLLAGGAWTADAWATSSGGTPSTANFPLPQDTAVIDNTGLNTSGVITFNSVAIALPSINSDTRTNAATLSLSGNPIIGGSVYIGSGVNLGSLTFLRLYGDGDIYLKNSNTAISVVPNLLSITATCNLLSNISSTSGATIGYGSLKLSSFTLTCSNLTFGNQYVNTSNYIDFGSGAGNITCTGTGTVWSLITNPNLTVTGTGTISLTSASAKTFFGGNFSYSGVTLNQGGAGALTITGANTFSNITNTYKSTGATSILFTAGTTSTFTDWNANGEATRLLTIGSDTAASHTLSKASGTVSAEYLSISRSTATGGATWNATNSTDGGNNSGWVFVVGGATGNFLVFF
jgi:hypothetical protein